MLTDYCVSLAISPFLLSGERERERERSHGASGASRCAVAIISGAERTRGVLPTWLALRLNLNIDESERPLLRYGRTDDAPFLSVLLQQVQGR